MSPFAGLAFHPLDGIMQVRRRRGQGCLDAGSLALPAAGEAPRRGAAAPRLPGPRLRGRRGAAPAPAPRPPPRPPPPPQALPYSWTLFYVPMHFLTHEMLLFFTSIWTTNIHDNIHAKVGRYLTASRTAALGDQRAARVLCWAPEERAAAAGKGRVP